MLRIAVDFDDTIVDNAYPKIGKPKLFAFETLVALQKKGLRLILWTVRTGKELDEAVEFCKQNGVEFYAVNKNYPEEVFDSNTARKIEADIFIDDRNVGGFAGWGEVWQMLFPEESDPKLELKRVNRYRKPSFLKRLFIKRQ
jgi:hydroxymethylpyrimidine pyrophosphatase-like HAD family hydrolase